MIKKLWNRSPIVACPPFLEAPKNRIQPKTQKFENLKTKSSNPIDQILKWTNGLIRSFQRLYWPIQCQRKWFKATDDNADGHDKKSYVAVETRFIWSCLKLPRTYLRPLMKKLVTKKLWNRSPIEASPPLADRYSGNFIRLLHSCLWSEKWKTIRIEIFQKTSISFRPSRSY